MLSQHTCKGQSKPPERTSGTLYSTEAIPVPHAAGGVI